MDKIKKTTSLKELRNDYKSLTGKKPFMGWDEEKLLEKIEEIKEGPGLTEDMAPFVGNSAEETAGETTPCGETVETYKTEEDLKPQVDYQTAEDLKPPLPEGLKTGKEVIAEKQAIKEKPVILEYSLPNKLLICDYLYRILMDGAYRAKVNEIAHRTDRVNDFLADLNELKTIVREGELKAEIDHFINILSNLL